MQRGEVWGHTLDEEDFKKPKKKKVKENSEQQDGSFAEFSPSKDLI